MDRVLNSILRFGIFDCTSGFRAHRSEVLRGVIAESVIRPWILLLRHLLGRR